VGSDSLTSNSSSPSTSASPWVLQTTEDGSEQYYYNIQTQEMRYSMPPDFYSDDQISQQADSFYNNTMHEYERPPTRPVRAANRVIADTDYRKTQIFMESRTPSVVPPLSKEDEFEDNNQVIETSILVFLFSPFLTSP
jgi:hypothetical protein